MPSCQPGCTCGRHLGYFQGRTHSAEAKAKISAAAAGIGHPCPPGCTCGRHSRGSCPAGCACGKHAPRPASPHPADCQCGVHTRPRLPEEESQQRKREGARARYRANPEKELERNARYREANRSMLRGKWRENTRARREADPEGMREIERRSRQNNLEQRRARDRAKQPIVTLKKHSMRPEDFAALWEAQMGRCCYCGNDLPRDRKQVHVDHDHSCCPPNKSCGDCRRGLACQGCNTGIGCLRDDPDLMIRVAENLRRLKAEARARIEARPVQGELLLNVVEFKREAG